MKTPFKLSILLLTLASLFYACRKKPHDLIGSVTVTGTVSDVISGEPIAHANVKMIKVESVFNGFGYVTVETDVVATTISNTDGKYSISYDFKGVLAIALRAEATDPLHVSSRFIQGNNDYIERAGSHRKDLTCNRSAFAEISLVNTPPIDTPYFISFSVRGLNQDLVLNNFSRDTTLYVKLIGSSSHKNQMRYNKNNELDTTYEIKAAAWDTLPMQLYY